MSVYGIGGYAVGYATIPGYRGAQVSGSGYICVGAIALAPHLAATIALAPRIAQPTGGTQINNGGC